MTTIPFTQIILPSNCGLESYSIFTSVFFILLLKLIQILILSPAPEFEMSDAQQEHALAIERLAPSLAALRIELCPGYMSEACFWMIYFVLLHPRLGKRDSELLSTTKVRPQAVALGFLEYSKFSFMNVINYWLWYGLSE